MNISKARFVGIFNDVYGWTSENIFNVKTLIEIGIIIAALIISFMMAYVIRKYFAKFATKIRQKWKLLSIPVKLFMGHLTGIFFPLILSIATLAVHLIDYKAYFIKSVTVLALIVLVIDLVSHLIESKLLSKFISYTLSIAIALKRCR